MSRVVLAAGHDFQRTSFTQASSITTRAGPTRTSSDRMPTQVYAGGVPCSPIRFNRRNGRVLLTRPIPSAQMRWLSNLMPCWVRRCGKSSQWTIHLQVDHRAAELPSTRCESRTLPFSRWKAEVCSPLHHLVLAEQAAAVDALPGAARHGRNVTSTACSHHRNTGAGAQVGHDALSCLMSR